MSSIFADTSGWGNIIDRMQPNHTIAVNLYRTARQQNRAIVTSNYIIAELTALLASPLRIPKASAIKFIQSLKTSSYVQIIYVDEVLDQQAWELFTSREDKTWSLVDCSSFVIMQNNGITEALTTDRHFEQAGFIRLLK